MRFVFILLVSAFAANSYAQSIVGLEEGDAAPFEGVLIDKDTAADIIASKELSDKKCDIRLEYEVGKATNASNLEKGISQANLDAEKNKNENIMALKVREIDRLNKELESASIDWGPAWFASGAFIGVAASLVIFFISVQTVNVDITEQ